MSVGGVSDPTPVDPSQNTQSQTPIQGESSWHADSSNSLLNQLTHLFETNPQVSHDEAKKAAQKFLESVEQQMYQQMVSFANQAKQQEKENAQEG